MSSYELIAFLLLSFIVACVISFGSTPFVKKFAKRVGAMDVPKDNRRMHEKPIARLGGLAIFFGFLVSVALFCEVNIQTFGIILGSIVIVVLGIFDDIYVLSAKVKLIFQIIASLIPISMGVIIEGISNPNFLSDIPYINFGVWSMPITLIWIICITNAVNLIDGLDGLAVGISSIASVTMLAVGLIIGQPQIAIIMAALAGACIGFMPYNINPAKIFMGDTGATFLGFILATASIQGMFKFYAIISFAVPFLILGLPIFDTCVAIFRRILSGKSPMSADRGHVHHRLIDMGFNQKQSVAILYSISGTLGLSAVVLTSSGEFKAMILLISVVIAVIIGAKLMTSFDNKDKPGDE